MSNWKNKVAVITGAGSGIGLGLARYAAAQGMHVVAADVDARRLEELKEALEAKQQSIITVTTDVSSPDAIEALAELVFDRYGKVNLLFNNAGILVDGKSWERSVEDWQRSINVNIMGVVNGIRSFVPRMLAQNEAGRVINTSSIGGILGGGTFMGPYQGTKHCVTAISETLYSELALESAPITASVLCPYEVATDIWSSVDRLRTQKQRNQLGSEEEQEFHKTVADNVAKSSTPDEFAAKVFVGIEADKFWLLPQPDFKPMFQFRVDSIFNESNPLSTKEIMSIMNQSTA